jgi:hypothetical protein
MMLETLRSLRQFRPIELNGSKRRRARAASIHDRRRVARQHLPRGVIDYIDGGADSRSIGRANLFGLGAGGEAGVDKVTGLLGDDIRRSMALVGRSSLAAREARHRPPSQRLTDRAELCRSAVAVASSGPSCGALASSSFSSSAQSR